MIFRRAIANTNSVLLALTLGLVPAPAHAEGSATDKAAADALFGKARKLFKAKKYEEACPKFEESYKLSERLGTLLNLATCHEEQGKTASAWAEFNEAEARAKRDKDKEREKYAKKHADKLEAELARITFHVPSAAKGATLELDGKEIGSSVWGTPLPVDPGSHQVSVQAAGKKPWQSTIEVKSASSSSIDVPPLEDAAETLAPSAEAHEAKPARERGPDKGPTQIRSAGGGKTLGIVVLGVGVVGVGVGSYFGLRTFSKKNQAADHCGSSIGQSDNALCDQTGVDLRSEAKSAATISTIAFGVGVVGLATGAVLLITSGGSSHEREAKRIWVTPVVTQERAALVMGGRM